MKKRLVALSISFLLLAILIASIDRQKLAEVMSGAHVGWFLLAILLFLPQTLAIAWRWTLIASPVAPIDWREAGRQVVASNCLNLVLPSKLGDLAKGVFLYRQGRCSLQDGIHIVVFEKLLDLAALSTWMWIGWVLVPDFALWVLGVLALGALIMILVATVYFSPRGARFLLNRIPAAARTHKKTSKIVTLLESGPRVMALVHADGRRRNAIVGWSFAIWFFHLLQIHCFFKTLGASLHLFDVLARMPIAIFAGLMPMTVAGVGVRDWALVTIFASPENPRALLVGVGLLVSLRYIVPALIGLPFVGRYFTMSKAVQANQPASK